MAGPTLTNPLEKLIRSLLKCLGRLMQEKAHAQIVITVRDGRIQLIEERRTFQPESFPE